MCIRDSTDTTGFGKFVPGFDFLQNVAKGASSNIPQMPNLGNWVAPTLNVEELEKVLDAFFRNPQDKTPLQGAPGHLSQMRGVLSVLGLDQACLLYTSRCV